MFKITIKSENQNGEYRAEYPYQIGNLLTSIAEVTDGKVHVEIERESKAAAQDGKDQGVPDAE